ncbi:autophagy protein Apg9-domain-containing protein [Radiomyces spectabilis]|uniref:autophagy protein Apg9-domain-containing protein n=1 Tax=Radiomyces spectabilis TaxID=64574 RepID=UPI002220CA31|nr:autophagy protein Apg9-domain-containing protein [Radiomyces spectabilis]KAI8391051.1 autophagy protein Apg9-domain-containing protein [Radiomyces spectabilis]
MTTHSALLGHQSSDDEYTLDPVNVPRRSRLKAQFMRPSSSRPTYQPLPSDHFENDEHEASDTSDLEAPPSLIVEQPAPTSGATTGSNTAPLNRFKRNLLHARTDAEPSTRDHLSTYDRTMWRWTNVQNMDNFFQRVYAYYQGKGVYCILFSRLLNLLTLAFVIVFSTFLIGCVNYSEIPRHNSMSEVVVPQCFTKLSFSKSMFLFIFSLWWIWQAIRFVRDIPALKEMHNFYHHLLHIPDEDMQTVAWQTVLERIIDIRETNPNTSEASPIRLNEHDVANRIMRKDNYLIALFNKDILNITIPLPYLRHKHVFTRDLEWNLSFCVLSYVFNDQGQIRKRFLKERNKPLLVAGLRRRFIFMGLLNLIFAPFILGYLLIFFFFRYFEEYHKNPSEIGSRGYSPFAKWKFREFNELPHFFRARLSLSYGSANQYINQFPKEKAALAARFVAFVSGSFAGVLALLSLYDSEALLNFEITPNGTVLFYLGIFGTVFAVSRGMIPDEHLVFEPERLLKEVVENTHYMPQEWRGKLHTDEVRAQFCQLFDYRVSLFLQELLSVIFTPVVLWFSLPRCAEQIVDFFREFTVHVDGLGYVCSFAQFDFARHGNIKYGAPTEVEDEYYMTKEGKMEKSFLNFKVNNPGWEPNDIAGSMYLSRLAHFQQQKLPHTSDTKDEPSGESREASPEPADVLHTPTFQRHHFVPQPMQPSNIEYSDPGTPSHPVEDRHVPSNLGDSFAHPPENRNIHYTWQPHEEEEEEEGEGADQIPRQAHPPVPGMLGLLNEFYDLNNNPGRW